MNLRTATLSHQCGVNRLCYTPRFRQAYVRMSAFTQMRQDRTGSHASRDSGQA